MSRASYRVALALFALSGSSCKYERTQAPGTSDAAALDADDSMAGSDAGTLGLATATIPLRIATTDTVSLVLVIDGPPSAIVAWSITSGGGSFQPSSGNAATNASGTGTIMVDYTAPATAGDLSHALALTAVSTVSAPFSTPVRTLIAAGENTPFADNAGIAVAADFLYGQQVFIPRDVVVMRLGTIAQLGGYTGRMALYSNDSGSPRDLIVGSALATIVAGPNELRVTPTSVAMGTYWLMGNFSATAQIKRDANVNNGQAYVMQQTSAALPTTLGATTAANNRVLNYYLLFAD